MQELALMSLNLTLVTRSCFLPESCKTNKSIIDHRTFRPLDSLVQTTYRLLKFIWANNQGKYSRLTYDSPSSPTDSPRSGVVNDHTTRRWNRSNRKVWKWVSLQLILIMMNMCGRNPRNRRVVQKKTRQTGVAWKPDRHWIQKSPLNFCFCHCV